MANSIWVVLTEMPVPGPGVSVMGGLVMAALVMAALVMAALVIAALVMTGHVMTGPVVPLWFVGFHAVTVNMVGTMIIVLNLSQLNWLCDTI